MKKIFILAFLFSLLSCQLYAQAKEIDEDELYETIIPNMTKPVVIDFFATWCAPCKIYHSTFTSVARTYNRYKADFYRIDIDENREVCSDFSINAVPTTIVLYSKDGYYLKEEGALDRSTLVNLVNQGYRKYKR